MLPANQHPLCSRQLQASSHQMSCFLSCWFWKSGKLWLLKLESFWKSELRRLLKLDSFWKLKSCWFLKLGLFWKLRSEWSPKVCPCEPKSSVMFVGAKFESSWHLNLGSCRPKLLSMFMGANAARHGEIVDEKMWKHKQMKAQWKQHHLNIKCRTTYNSTFGLVVKRVWTAIHCGEHI